MTARHDLSHVMAALARPARHSSDFDLNPELKLPAARKLRPASVLVPLTPGRDGIDVILTKRASHLKHHPGQIAFPGGKREEGDADAVATALRESEEEIGLPPHQVAVLGELPFHETVTNYQVTPVLGWIEAQFVPVPEAGEVAEVFRVPLAFLLDLQSYRIERRRWSGVWRQYYAAPYGPYYIWGATARMLRGLADRSVQ